MDPRIEKVYDYIKRRYQSKLLLSDLAKKAGLSSFHFQRLFKKEMGESPAACLNRIRLERAAHFMASGSSISISELATDCGFPSLSSFSRAFSQRHRMSPLAFIKNVTTISLAPTIKPLDVEVVYFPGMNIYYRHTSINNPKLMDEFASAKTFCEKNSLKTEGRKIGIVTYVTFHYPHEKLNYYAGVDIARNDPKYEDQIYPIPKGKYACFTSVGSIQQFRELLMQFKREWMDPKGYGMRDLFSFEEFSDENKNSNYPFLKRKLFVPIKKN
jgi:AraC-like DNA-binding protein/predicted transcriptional regulator YdeE